MSSERNHPQYGTIKRVGFDAIRPGMHLIHLTQGDIGVVLKTEGPTSKFNAGAQVNKSVTLQNGNRLLRARCIGKSFWRVVNTDPA